MTLVRLGSILITLVTAWSKIAIHETYLAAPTIRAVTIGLCRTRVLLAVRANRRGAKQVTDSVDTHEHIAVIT